MALLSTLNRTGMKVEARGTKVVMKCKSRFSEQLLRELMEEISTFIIISKNILGMSNGCE